MHVRVLRAHRRKWPPPRNHYDRRLCPDCGNAAYGDEGQRKHERYHDRQAERIDTLAALVVELASLARVPVPDELTDWAWGSQFTGTEPDYDDTDEAVTG